MKARTYKIFNSNLGPQITLDVTCRDCKYLKYEYDSFIEKEKATCLKNEQVIYDSKQRRVWYEFETPIWCPLIESEKLEKIKNDIDNLEIKD